MVFMSTPQSELRLGNFLKAQNYPTWHSLIRKCLKTKQKWTPHISQTSFDVIKPKLMCFIANAQYLTPHTTDSVITRPSWWRECFLISRRVVELPQAIEEHVILHNDTKSQKPQNPWCNLSLNNNIQETKEFTRGLTWLVLPHLTGKMWIIVGNIYAAAQGRYI